MPGEPHNQDIVHALQSRRNVADALNQRKKFQYDRAIAAVEAHRGNITRAVDVPTKNITKTILKEIEDVINEVKPIVVAMPTPAQIQRAQARGAPAEYRPGYRTAAWAILVAMRRASLDPLSAGYLTKDQIVRRAQPLAQHAMVGHGRTGWMAMKHTLEPKHLVRREALSRHHGNFGLQKDRFYLTEEGKQPAESLEDDEGNGLAYGAGGAESESDVDLDAASDGPEEPGIAGGPNGPTILDDEDFDVEYKAQLQRAIEVSRREARQRDSPGPSRNVGPPRERASRAGTAHPTPPTTPSPRARMVMSPTHAAGQAALKRQMESKQLREAPPPDPTSETKRSNGAAPAAAAGKASTVACVVDLRERLSNKSPNDVYLAVRGRHLELFPLGSQPAVQTGRRTLPIADYLWVSYPSASHSGPPAEEADWVALDPEAVLLPVAVERKTLADLAGRSHDRDHLKQLSALCSPGIVTALTHRILLVESSGTAGVKTLEGLRALDGGPNPEPGTKITSPQEFFALVSDLILHSNEAARQIKVFNTADNESSSRFLAALTKWIVSKGASAVGSRPKLGSFGAVVAGSRPNGPDLSELGRHPAGGAVALAFDHKVLNKAAGTELWSSSLAGPKRLFVCKVQGSHFVKAAVQASATGSLEWIRKTFGLPQDPRVVLVVQSLDAGVSHFNRSKEFRAEHDAAGSAYSWLIQLMLGKGVHVQLTASKEETALFVAALARNIGRALEVHAVAHAAPAAAAREDRMDEDEVQIVSERPATANRSPPRAPSKAAPIVID
ncbi:hypothetical protein DFJ74DRAFT_667669 [Hyaloraphidium curvatum]|nr:hypothetical protein DFJ74DRAFT_667669 [Hyaloraphidium curvatum]